MLLQIAGSIAALALGAAPADAVAPRQFGSFSYTSRLPGFATGLVANLTFQNPENPSLKPPAVTRMVVRGPAGGVIDTNVPARCHASDAQLMVEGPAGCPAGSKVGSGFAVTDSGGGGPFPRYSRATIIDFNTQGGIIGVGVNNDISAIKTVDHTTIRGGTSTTKFPLLTDLPPAAPVFTLKRLHFVFPPYVRSGRAYDRTPPTCPSVGHWTFTARFTYADGVTQTLTSHSSCHSRKKKRKSLRRTADGSRKARSG